MEEIFEVIGVEHLKTILSNLSPEEIVKPAYDNWFPTQKTGHTILDLETGEVRGLSIEHNQMPLQSMMYIELYTIKSSDYPVEPEEMLSKTEYEEFMDFMEDEPSEFAPDMVSIFCQENDIDEDSRNIGILAYRFSTTDQQNYNMWESAILNKYYDKTDENHNPFKFNQSSLWWGCLVIRFITLILKNPFRNKTRSALSIIGIAIGIATIVALGLITAGMEDSVQTSFNQGGAEITVTNSTNIGGSSGLLDMSLISDLKNISNVSDAVGQLSVSESAQSYSQSSRPMMQTRVYGFDASKLNLIGIKDVNGSVYENNSYDAIVGVGYSELNNVSIGDNFTFLGHDFKITGIYETGSIMTDNGVYVSLDTLQNISDTDKVSSILVKTSESTNDTIVSNEIKDKNNNLSTLTSEEMSSILDDVTGILNTASLAISGLAIIVGGIGVINTMVMTVYERTKEIGVLKSIGWKSKKVLVMIMGETLVLTTLSGIIGSIFGILIAEIGVRLIGTDGFSLVYTPGTFILAFGITIIVGIIGGVYPAYKASKLAPTEALRYE